MAKVFPVFREGFEGWWGEQKVAAFDVLEAYGKHILHKQKGTQSKKQYTKHMVKK